MGTPCRSSELFRAHPSFSSLKKQERPRAFSVRKTLGGGGSPFGDYSATLHHKKSVASRSGRVTFFSRCNSCCRVPEKSRRKAQGALNEPMRENARGIGQATWPTLGAGFLYFLFEAERCRAPFCLTPKLKHDFMSTIGSTPKLAGKWICVLETII